jgi:hypothetical protein
MFCKNPIKPRFIFAVSSTSFTDGCFYVAQFSVLYKQLYYLWSMIFGCQSSERLMFLHVPSARMILNDSTVAVDVIKLLNLSRPEVDTTSPLLL